MSEQYSRTKAYQVNGNGNRLSSPRISKPKSGLKER